MNLQDTNYKIFGSNKCKKLLNNLDRDLQVKMKYTLTMDLRGYV